MENYSFKKAKYEYKILRILSSIFFSNYITAKIILAKMIYSISNLVNNSPFSVNYSVGEVAFFDYFGSPLKKVDQTK